ncbi:hypothetical protein LZC95_50375 [Pendulispora brunnea]|uniref:Uncharacterized protein n=1 Tax=Pendulispora brunnea TaxID=2905690 RepID=A0ABZ2KB85_9BACT
MAAVLEAFHPRTDVDNGFDLDKTVGMVRDAMNALGARVQMVAPRQIEAPVAGTDSVTITPIVPRGIRTRPAEKHWAAAQKRRPRRLRTSGRALGSGHVDALRFTALKRPDVHGARR